MVILDDFQKAFSYIKNVHDESKRWLAAPHHESNTAFVGSLGMNANRLKEMMSDMDKFNSAYDILLSHIEDSDIEKDVLKLANMFQESAGDKNTEL